MKKKYYYTIGEVSNLLNIKAHVLRYWEKEFPSLSPRKTIRRNRQYTEEDIALIRRIDHMLHVQRFTIEGVRKKLKEMRKNKEQIQLDFGPSREEVKATLVNELKELKEMLATH